MSCYSGSSAEASDTGEDSPAVCGTDQPPCYQPRTFWYDGLGRRILMKADSASGATECYLAASLAKECGMRGVRYLYNDKGKKTAVLIDLRGNSALWEELLDVALAQTRATERTESWRTVRGRLERRGRLKRAFKSA